MVQADILIAVDQIGNDLPLLIAHIAVRCLQVCVYPAGTSAQPYWKPGTMGRPVKVDRREVVNAIFYVAATGCQWRALPEKYPNWNTARVASGTCGVTAGSRGPFSPAAAATTSASRLCARSTPIGSSLSGNAGSLNEHGPGS